MPSRFKTIADDMVKPPDRATPLPTRPLANPSPLTRRFSRSPARGSRRSTQRNGLRSHLSSESDSPLKLTQQRGIRAPSVIPPRSTSRSPSSTFRQKRRLSTSSSSAPRSPTARASGRVVNTARRYRLPRAHSPDAEHHAARQAQQSSRRTRGVARHDLAPMPFNGVASRFRTARLYR